MAWIEKIASGWVVRWRGEGRDGPKPASPTYETKAEALDAKRDIEKKLPPRPKVRKAGPRPIEPMTIAQLAADWRTTLSIDPKRQNRPGALEYLVEAEKTAIATATDLGWAKPRDARREDVTKFRERYGRTRDRKLAYLRSVLRWGARNRGTSLDEQVSFALAAPPSQRAEVELLTEEQIGDILKKATAYDQEALFSCLATYGWRPITACRLKVRDVHRDGTITIGVKRNGPWTHPLFPKHVEQLAKLAEGRDADEPLFRSPKGKPWRIDDGRAVHIGVFYRDNLAPEDSRAGNLYALKRYAITRMDEGAAPWTRRLSLPEIRLFTGHKSDAQVMRYMRTNIERARSVMGEFGAVG